MRRLIVLVLAAIETLVACAIFACSLQLSHAIARSHTLENAAATVVRIATDGVRMRITIGDA
jgi:hypothetical protein